MNFPRVRRRPDRPDIERTARILVDRLGDGAFDFAARRVATLHLADRKASTGEWRAIALEIERLARDVVNTAGPETARPLQTAVDGMRQTARRE